MNRMIALAGAAALFGLPAYAQAPAPAGDGTPFTATAEVPCAPIAGQPTHACGAGVVRGASGAGVVWIAMGSGDRSITFEGGAPVSSNGGAVMVEKLSDLFLIRIGDERYEVPEAFVFGG